jgi:hypothetical protein
MYNEDVLDLYPRANVGTKVTVTYRSFSGVATSGGAPSSSGGASSSGGGFFNSLFGIDEPPPERPRPRRSVPAKSAAIN